MSGPNRDSSERQRLLDSLWEDARREGDQLVKEARLKADRLREEAAVTGEQMFTEALDGTRARMAPELARIANRARVEADSRLLEARNRVLDTCFSGAARKLAEDPGTLKRVRAALAALLDRSLDTMDGMEDVAVLVSPLDREEAERRARSRHPTISVAAEDGIGGGVRVTARGGADILDNSVIARLQRVREDPPVELYGILFGDDTGESPPP